MNVEEELEEGVEVDSTSEAIDPDSDEAIELAGKRTDAVAEEEEVDDASEYSEELAEIAGNSGDMVPLSRLNEVLERERRREQEISDFLLAQRAEQAKPVNTEQPFDINAAIRQRNKLLVEGNEDDAYAIDERIEEEREKRATLRAVEMMEHRQTERSASKAANAIIVQYPQLNDDPDLVDEVVALRNSYLARGVPMEEAISKAAKRLLGDPVSSDDAGKQPDNDEVAARRIKAQQRNAGVKQPAAISDAGRSGASLGLGSKIDPRSITEEAFNKMTSTQLDELERSLASPRKTV
jgi:hypothetical protein